MPGEDSDIEIRPFYEVEDFETFPQELRERDSDAARLMRGER
jgi:hypothetical protein